MSRVTGGAGTTVTRGKSAIKRAVVWLLRRLDERLRTDLLGSARLGVALAPRIAAGPAKLRVVLAAVLLGTGRWRRPIALRLVAPGGGTMRFKVPDYAAMMVLLEMFVDRPYALDLDEPPTTIVDLGASTGASVLFFRRRYPHARIVAVEASPTLVELLRQNTVALDVDVRHAAVAPTAGTATFYESPESWAGSTTHAVGTPVAVPAITLDELLDGPVDLVKMDIEGAEFDVLPATRRLANIKVLLGEIHAAPSTPECQRVLGYLEGFEVYTHDVGPSERLTTFAAVRAVVTPGPLA